MAGLKTFTLKLLILTAMLLGLPLLGVFAAGYPLRRYLEFPPATGYVSHASFSWAAFGLYGAIIVAVVRPLGIRGLRPANGDAGDPAPRRPFPWWGWLGVLGGGVVWILAWSRFPWFSRWQMHTFTPLWLAFILVINGLSRRRSGRCLMTDRPLFFVLLFPVSAMFWWFFEYLNRFVQNWYYLGPHLSSAAYFWNATLPFSTVLPAVLSTRQWILSAGWMQRRFGDMRPVAIPVPRLLAASLLAVFSLALAGIGVWPDYLFSLLWISPLMILVCLQTLWGEKHVFSEMAGGQWRGAVSAALAALLCGFFWEMWNYYSLAKWRYCIPFVHRFQVFEMPLLGYAGYLPFGLECSVVGDLVGRMIKPGNLPPEAPARIGT